VGEVAILQVQPTELHRYWDFTREGLARIRRKVPTDWIEEDIYWYVRQNAAQLFIVSRNERWLGGFINYVQNRPFSGQRELFLWCVWTLRLRDRREDDNIPEAIAKSLEFMHNQKRAAGCDRIVHLSSRKGFERYGFQPTITSWVAR
jgi:hypothetical protein